MDEWLDPANNPRERGRRLEEDSNQDFIKGYAKGDDIPIRRAFNAWIDGGLCSEIDYQTPDTKSFALHNTQDKVIRSIADLDEHHAPRVQMACKVARQHRWHVFLGRLRSSWYGPKDRSPNRQMKKRARESPDRPPPPGIRTLSDPDSYPFNNVEETEQSLIELHTIEGDMVVPGGEGYIRDLSLIQIDDYHFIQDDFLPLKPETEEEKRPKNQKGPWVKQTWHTNILFIANPAFFILTFSGALMDNGKALILPLARYVLTRSLALSDNNDFDRYAHKDAKELIKRIYEKRYEPYDWSDFSKWYITAQVKTLMLRFALNQRDIDLFKKGCAIQFEGDTLPSPEIFKWVRQHHAKHQAIQFVEVEQSLLDLALSYPTLRQRYEAVYHLVIDVQQPGSRPAETPLQDLGKRIITGSRAFIPLLETAGDGRALVDICLHYKDILLFQKSVLDRILNMSPNFWIFGFLERVLDLGFTHLFRDNPASDVYREVLSRLVPALKDMWASVDPKDYQGCEDRVCYFNKPPRPTPKVEPQDLVRFLHDLVQLKHGEVLKKTVSTMVKRLNEIAWQHGSKAFLRDFWLPFLHELAAHMTYGRGSSSALLFEPNASFQPLFKAVLTCYACARVGMQPPSQPNDLRRGPCYRYQDRPELAKLVSFLEDATRKEARFPDLDKDQKAAARDMTEMLKVEIKYDRSTKPFTLIMTKLSESDPDKHAAWNKRKEDFKTDVLLKFADQEFLKEMLGGERGYDRMTELTFLLNGDQQQSSVAAAGTLDGQEQRSDGHPLQAIQANVQLTGMTPDARNAALNQGSENADRASKRVRVE